MWWGGGGNPEPDPTMESSTSASTPEDVMEILSEEDAASHHVEDVTEDSDEELKSLKEQFMQQESLLGQLKGALKSNEEKLLSKEKEVQVCCMPISHFSCPFLL